MSRRMKRRLKELKGLARLDAGGPLITRYPPDGGRAQLFKRELTKKRKASEGS